MLAKILGAALAGIDAYTVEVEVDLARGTRQGTTLGLPARFRHTIAVCRLCSAACPATFVS